MKKINVVITGTSLVAGLLLCGCCSIMHGTRQQVGISSTPSGAIVTVSGHSYGKTPTIADLRRGDNHIVKIEMPGYLPYETTLTKSVSGWAWGNILAGGLIGLAVDAINGGLYNLSPEQVQANMTKEGGSHFSVNEDGLYFFVTLNPDPTWKCVGQMTRAH